ncbi:MAG: fibronectin type III domain-containing protein [candidate division Zixibacteria bacterium]|nr:fibronectin type III domain-containing protein [candidate division Zixibacteria bacterium]
MKHSLGKLQFHIRRSQMSSMFLTLFILFVVMLMFASPVNALLVASGESSNSITLTWTAPGDDGDIGTASQYDIRYSTSTIDDGNWNSATQVDGELDPQATGETETFDVSGLTSSTTYYFAIKTADEVPNWSELSNVVTATTDVETDAPTAVADLHISGNTSTTATLDWTAPGDDGTNGTAYEYELRYSTSSITDVNWSSATLIAGVSAPQIAGSDETFTVEGLDPSTMYYFAIKTADEVPNWSDLSNVPSVTTDPEEIPPSDIEDLIALVSTASTISLGWTAPGDDGTSGTAYEYELRYSTSPITDVNWSSATLIAGVHAPQTAGSDETFTVEGLDLSTTYYFAIKTADEVPNWSGISNVISASTTGDTTPPNAITDLQQYTN